MGSKENNVRLGIGFYKDMLRQENYRFAKQAGCTDIIAHLANYYTDGMIVPGTDGRNNYGICRIGDEWSLDSLIGLRREIEGEGLHLEGIENFSPADWYDILLDGPLKQKQMDNLKTIIRNVGKAGIPVFGYNFSIAGVWGHTRRNAARGGADTACFDREDGGEDLPIPNGQVWNMVYDVNAPEGFLRLVSHEELWERWSYFINEITPVAEEYGVKMAAHPDDPPMPRLRGQARLVYETEYYQKMLDINKSASNCFEFCMGSVQEMRGGNVYEAIQRFAPEKRLAYIHFRNVKGKVPHYVEAFVDDGDIDMIQCVKLLKKHKYDGVLIPDHTPQLECGAPWHAGMAYALGYMKAALRMAEGDEN